MDIILQWQIGGKMKKLIVLVGALIISASSIAGFSQSQLNTLGTSFKNQTYVHPKLNKSDIAIVYGGADVSRKPTLAYRTTTA
jgi:archaellum component FlaG (FlaF/FlaG flagellin family)